jgi:Domain of unknown function (DUF4345)
MLIHRLRRGLLYVSGAFFVIFGLTVLFAPGMITNSIHLMPSGRAGLGEMRGLYGGGFFGFGLVILAGLRCPASSQGLLLAMSIILGGIVVGRLLSLVLDQDFSFAAPNALFEFIIAAACYYESRHGLART